MSLWSIEGLSQQFGELGQVVLVESTSRTGNNHLSSWAVLPLWDRAFPKCSQYVRTQVDGAAMFSITTVFLPIVFRSFRPQDQGLGQQVVDLGGETNINTFHINMFQTLIFWGSPFERNLPLDQSLG